MIVEFTALSGLRLVEASDMKRFKVVVRGGARHPPEIDGLIIDGNDVLVPIDLVRSLSGVPDDQDWRAGFEMMVAKAEEFGWIDAERRAIRAHVEQVE